MYVMVLDMFVAEQKYTNTIRIFQLLSNILQDFLRGVAGS